jgi:hypothetical protein
VTASVCPTCGGAHGTHEQVSSDDVLRAVAHEYSVRIGDIVAADRHQTKAIARHVAALLLRFVCRQSYTEIARTLARRDHTSAIHAVRRIAALMLAGDAVCSHVTAICASLPYPVPPREWLAQFALVRAVARAPVDVDEDQSDAKPEVA